MSNADRTERPTPSRLREARQRGELPTSTEFTGTVLALVMVVALAGQAATILGTLRSLLGADLAFVAHPRTLTTATVVQHLRDDLGRGMMALLPLVVTAVIAALVLGAITTRGFFSPAKLMPSARKLNPLSNIKHLFSRETLVLALKALLKLALATVVVLIDLPWWRHTVALLSLLRTPEDLSAVWSAAFGLALRITAAFAAIGAIDQAYRYFAWYQRLRMTRQEVKDEAKRMEGNPQIRAQMRATARKRLRTMIESGSVRRVPQATVVITNPTHFAVAILYTEGRMRAPRVIAKGQDVIALRIKDVARKHGVPIVEDKPLAQALYKTVRVNRDIPPELYRAVAEVLGFVYRLRARGRRAATRSVAR